MDIQEKANFLINYIRSSKRRIFVSLLIAAIISVSVFIAASYYLMFNYYDKIVKSYYNTILKDVYSFQQKLISKYSYEEDFKTIARAVINNEGVIDTWVSNRYGKLIYHTDNEIDNKFKSKRLPAEYYKSISHIWKFENGYPKINIVPIKRLLTYRLSIPIYSFDHKDYDFVFGIDVKRFVYMPDDINIITFITLGVFIFSILILFLPIFFLIKGNFNTIFTQIRVFVGSVKLQLASRSVESEKLEVKQKVEGYEEEIREEKVVEKEDIKKTEVMEKVKEKLPVKNLLLQLMKEKQRLFKNHGIKLPNIEAQSFLYHSKTPKGSYIYYHNKENIHCYFIFSFPEISPEISKEKLQSTVRQIDYEVEKSIGLKEILSNYNNCLYKNNIKQDFSILRIDEKESNIWYTSCGSGKGIYLKNNENKFKNVEFDIPLLGEKKEDEFLNNLFYAEIDFVRNDIFILPAQNCSGIIVNSENLEELIKRITLENREKTVQEIGKEIQNIFEPFRRRKKDIPETGYVLLKIV